MGAWFLTVKGERLASIQRYWIGIKCISVKSWCLNMFKYRYGSGNNCICEYIQIHTYVSTYIYICMYVFHSTDN